MKWVMLSLLLLNGLYFALQLNTAPVVEEAPRDDYPFQGKDLVLLTEKKQEDEAKKIVKPSHNEHLAVPKNKMELKPEKKQATVNPKPEQKIVAEPPVDKKDKPISVAARQPLQAAPAPVEKPRQSVKVKPILLAKSCYTIGPFLLMSDASSAANIFERADIYAEQRSKAQRKQVGYWVYVPPLASAKQAAVAQQRIQNKGVKDVQLIAEGNKANALSAGVYQVAAQAEERRRLIATLGYLVKVEPLYRTQPQYWLDVALMESTKLPSRLWGEISSSRPNIRQERRKCN